MQIESVFHIPTLSAQLFIALSVVSILIGVGLTIFGLVRQKKYVSNIQYCFWYFSHSFANNPNRCENSLKDEGELGLHLQSFDEEMSDMNAIQRGLILC